MVVALLCALLCLLALPAEHTAPGATTASDSTAGIDHGDDGEAPARSGRADVVAKSRRGSLQPAPARPSPADHSPSRASLPLASGPRMLPADRRTVASPLRAAAPNARDPRLSLYPGQAPPLA